MVVFGMDGSLVVCTILAFVLYINTLPADFVYDDSRAILRNPDVLGETPLSALLYNDFWGTTLTHSGSHRSYRPLTVLTFRANRFVDIWLGRGTDPHPASFHLVNCLLHAATTALFVCVGTSLVGDTAGLWAGLMFAVHPVHTEAVAGVVGRADVLAALFFMLALQAYIRYCGTRRWRHLYVTVLCGVAAMLSKEQGVTVFGVCVIYDVFVYSRLTPKQTLRLCKKRHRRPLEGVLCLVLVSVLCVCSRLYVMGLTAPSFAPADNPAADSDSVLTRTLTFAYLPILNVWLVVCPYVLSFDWSMDAVPLVESFLDPRVLLIVVFYATLVMIGAFVIRNLNADEDSTPPKQNGHCTGQSSAGLNACFDDNSTYSADRKLSLSDRTACNGSAVVQRNGVKRRPTSSNGRRGRRASSSSTDSNQSTHRQLDMSSLRVVALTSAMIILPFLPASNLFFYVGFVIAERVLYIPSAGLCLLIAHGGVTFYHRWPSARKAVIAAGVALLVAFATRTVRRNRDWLNEEQLYTAGISVNPAKAWGNLANVLNNQGRTAEAETAYRTALQHRANMADVHYNLGIMLQEQKRYEEAIDSYHMALQCRPRLTMAYLNLGIIYAALDKNKEAEKMYRHCAEIDLTGLKDPRLHEQTRISALYNLGRLLADDEQYQNAIQVYKEAIRRKPSHYASQSLYNMLGESYFKLDHLVKAEYWYKEALSVKPDHVPAYLTMAKLYQRYGTVDVAEDWFLKAKATAPTDSSVYQHYAQFLGETGRHLEAAEMYKTASKWSHDGFELIVNTANALRQAGQNNEAETYYKKAAVLRPDMATAHMNLGAILHYNGHLSEAEQSYLTALRLKPDDEVTRTNLRKLRNLMQRGTAR